MLFQVCDHPETTGIGIIQPDETKTYTKKQKNAGGFLMDKLTKLPTSRTHRTHTHQRPAHTRIKCSETLATTKCHGPNNKHNYLILKNFL